MSEKRKRTDDMIERYMKGETLKQIGVSYGISREWVRRILKDQGIDGKMGGQSVWAKATQKRVEERREWHAQHYWGLSVAEHAAIKKEHGYKPFGLYIEQRKNARQRGIGWELSFKQWWSFWADSGYWEQRGRGSASACVMARRGDVGPYAIGNIYICTVSQNFADYRAQKKSTQSTQRA